MIQRHTREKWPNESSVDILGIFHTYIPPSIHKIKPEEAKHIYLSTLNGTTATERCRITVRI